MRDAELHRARVILSESDSATARQPSLSQRAQACREPPNPWAISMSARSPSTRRAAGEVEKAKIESA